MGIESCSWKLRVSSILTVKDDLNQNVESVEGFYFDFTDFFYDRNDSLGNESATPGPQLMSPNVPVFFPSVRSVLPVTTDFSLLFFYFTGFYRVLVSQPEDTWARLADGRAGQWDRSDLPWNGHFFFIPFFFFGSWCRNYKFRNDGPHRKYVCVLHSCVPVGTTINRKLGKNSVKPHDMRFTDVTFHSLALHHFFQSKILLNFT